MGVAVRADLLEEAEALGIDLAKAVEEGLARAIKEARRKVPEKPSILTKSTTYTPG